MSQIYTSYFGNRHLPEHCFRVQVSASRPRTYGVSAVLYPALPDKATMTAPLREGSVTWDTYAGLYRKALKDRMPDILAALEEIEAAAGDRPVVLLSYGGKDRPDSRAILAGQLSRLANKTVTEL